MDIQVKLLNVLPEVKGTSAKGEWKKQDAIFETAEQFPKKVCISFWSEKVDELKKISEGSSVKVHINLESREYNGKWYTDIRAWKIEAADSGATPNSETNFSRTIDRPHTEPADLTPSSDAVDDLPF